MGYDVQQTRDGGYVVVGETHVGPNVIMTLWILRLDSLGDTIWTRKYRPSGWADCGTAVTVTPDQGFLVATWAAGIDTLTPGTIYVLRTDSLGDTLWSRFYRFGTSDEEVFRVIPTADGNYVLAGYSIRHSCLYALLFKIDGLGDTLWARTYGDSASGGAYGGCVAQTPDHGFILSGFVIAAPQGAQGLLLRTDSMGNPLWTRTYGGCGDDEFGADNAPNGFIAVGRTDSYGAGGSDAWVLWLNDSGDTIRTRTYGGPEDDDGRGQPTFGGGCIIASQSFSFGAGACDVWLVKTDSVGDTEWTRTFGGPGWDGPNYVRQTRDSGYIIVGSTNSFSAYNGVYLIKTDGSGSAAVADSREDRRPEEPVPLIRVPGLVAGELTCQYFQPVVGRARIELFDASGRRLSSVDLGCHSAGWYDLQVLVVPPAGARFLRLLTNGQSAVAKFIVP